MRPDRRLYLTLFVITMATLMFEILLTRIFSVTMWYHFAFMVVSVAMFGLAGGALIVHFRPEVFTPERAREQIGASSFGFALSMVVSVMLHIATPADQILSLLLAYVLMAVPFIFSGIAVCLALTRYPDHVSKLYAADLLGAASGCIVIVLLLKAIDGITAVFVIALLATGAAMLLLGRSHVLSRYARIGLAAFGLMSIANATLALAQWPHLGIRWTKGRFEADVQYEKWNHFSRIGVYDAPSVPTGWGLSPAFVPQHELRQLWLRIDGVAGTLLTGFDGDYTPLDHLKYDVSNLVHYLRSKGSVLIIGAGGGRDILSARLFGHQKVVAVELNGNILETVNGRYGDFTGHLDEIPSVRFVNDEARAYVANSKERFDVIQASWIDTWAATAAGAFALTENSLYTVDSWKVFLDHLQPDGILTMTREYTREDPRHAARLLALGRGSLEAVGVASPERHMMLVVNVLPPKPNTIVPGNSTILVSPTPFSAEDVATLTRVASRMKFEIAWAPGVEGSDFYRTIASGDGLDELQESWGFRLDPPTANSPFFFNMLSMRKLLLPQSWRDLGKDPNLQAVSNLLILQLVVLVLAIVCLILPLARSRTVGALPSGSTPLLVFFCAIGLGFMLVEVAEMQQLSVFLGHPTYGVAVVLFSLLLGSGSGSLLTQRLPADAARRYGGLVLLALVALLGAIGVASPAAVESLQSQPTATRIIVAVFIMTALGLLMGTAFPLGMKNVRGDAAALTPWFWGMNGATSVVASVTAVVLSLEWGIDVAYWSGTGAYVLASAAFVLAARQPEGALANPEEHPVEPAGSGDETASDIRLRRVGGARS
jgi:hypothetical protein